MEAKWVHMQRFSRKTIYVIKADIIETTSDRDSAQRKLKDAESELQQCEKWQKQRQAEMDRLCSEEGESGNREVKSSQDLKSDMNQSRLAAKQQFQQRLAALEQKCHADCEEYKEKGRTLHMRALDLPDRDMPNHIFFAVDHSGSMRGAKWTALNTAVERFRDVRLEHEAHDRVSLITFDSTASIALLNEDLVSAKLREKLQEVSAWGGTRFAPAFQRIKEGIEATPEPCRNIVVLVTDGESSSGDRDQAAEEAAKLYKRVPLTTIVVVVEGGVSEEQVIGLVKAGNGGKTMLNKNGRSFKYFQNTTAQTMTSNFKAIAAQSFSEHEELLARSKEAYQEAHKRRAEFQKESKALKEQCDAQVRDLESLENSLQQAAGTSTASEVLSKKKDHLARLLEEAKTQTRTAVEAYESRKKEVELAKANVEQALQIEADSKEATEQSRKMAREAITQQSEAQVKMMEELKQGGEQGLLSDEQEVNVKVHQLDRMSEKFRTHRSCVAATRDFVRGLCRICAYVVGILENPALTWEDSIGSAAVCRAMLEKHSIDFDDQREANSTENYRKILVKFACDLDVEEGKVDIVVKAVINILDLEEDFCAVTEIKEALKDDEDPARYVDKRIKKCVEKVETRILQKLRVPHPSKLKENRQELKEKLKEVKAEIKEGVAMQREGRSLPEGELTEIKLRVGQLKEDKERLEARVEKLEEDIEKSEEALEQCDDAASLVRKTMKEFSSTFVRECERKRIESVLDELSSQVKKANDAFSNFYYMRNYEGSRSKAEASYGATSRQMIARGA